MSILINDKLPSFIGINQDGKPIDSQQFLGKKLILFFFPKANTPACSAEACSLSNHYETLKKQGYQLLGISADEMKKQKKFHEKHQFPYDLIADENHEISQLFGVWQLKKMMGREYMGIVRTTFIFDEKGICIDIITKVNTKFHAEQILGIDEQ